MISLRIDASLMAAVPFQAWPLYMARLASRHKDCIRAPLSQQSVRWEHFAGCEHCPHARTTKG